MPLNRPELQQEIEQFLFHEADLLDTHQLDAWLALFTEDARYRMPIRSTRANRDSAQSWSGPDEVAYFDDSKAALALRIRRLGLGSAWAEEPRSRTRHFVSNVRITPGDADGAYEIACNFLVYRNRAEAQTDLFAGERRDSLVRSGGGFQIAGRLILLDQSVLQANNISFFF